MTTNQSQAHTYSISTGSISGDDVENVILLNLGMFVLDLALSGICFFASCWFNLSKNAIAVGGGIAGASLLASLIRA